MGDEPEAPYDRPPLSKQVLAGDRAFDDIDWRPRGDGLWDTSRRRCLSAAFGDMSSSIRCAFDGRVEAVPAAFAVGDVAARYDERVERHVRWEHRSSEGGAPRMARGAQPPAVDLFRFY